MNRKGKLALGALAAIGVAELWHGPIGAANDLQGDIDRETRALLDYYELPQVKARLDDQPLSRRVILSGPADDFQRRALVEKVGELPGVNEVRWDPTSPVITYPATPPKAVEAEVPR